MIFFFSFFPGHKLSGWLPFPSALASGRSIHAEMAVVNAVWAIQTEQHDDEYDDAILGGAADSDTFYD